MTFNIEFPDYINQPFPFEYPSIAGFYSNVDTTDANETTSISIFSSQDPEQLEKVSELVRYAYVEQSDFEATDIVVATWKNVGYFESKTDKLNTFQVGFENKNLYLLLYIHKIMELFVDHYYFR